MMTTNSIILHLDIDLKLASVEVVNSKVTKFKILQEIWREGKVLNLSELLADLWQKVAQEGHLDGVDKFIFLIGPNAGFTDSRVIYIWLKTEQMFKQTEFRVLKIGQLDIESLDLSMIQDLIQQAIENGTQELQYISEPRIG